MKNEMSTTNKNERLKLLLQPELLTDNLAAFRRFSLKGHTPVYETLAIPLNKLVAAEIAKICNNSPVLVYNFYAGAMAAMVSKYSGRPEMIFISPAFDMLDLREEGYICPRLTVSNAASYKSIFTTNKEQLMTAVDNACSGEELLISCTQLMEETPDIGFCVEAAGQSALRVPCALQIMVATGSVSVTFDKQQLYSGLLELLLQNYTVLLEEIVHHLYEPLETLLFQSEKEKELTAGFNGPQQRKYFDISVNVIQEIENRVPQMPEYPAMMYGARQLSYDQLNRQANNIAHYLMNEAGVVKGDFIGVLMDRSDKMATAILGIWKAGAAYIPVDLTYPQERIREMLGNANARAVLGYQLTDGNLKTVIQELTTFIDLHTSATALKQQADTNPEICIAPDDAAYMIYTSGTTGKPKGVMVAHLGMRNHMGAKIADLEIPRQGRIAQNAPHCFDISVWQYFAALLCNGTTHIYDNDLILEPAAFMQQIQDNGITTLELVPSYFSLMLDVLDADPAPYHFGSLNCLVLQAEPLLPSMVTRWYRHFPHIVIYNAYGITETSDDISHYKVTGQEDTLTVPVARGFIQHSHVYLVDENLRPVPVGARGEILIAGECVGLGYYNNPEQTALRFLKGPVKNVTAETRLYLTGDIGRFLPDGRLEFFGRKDAQVKIRGQRVELTEIEVRLAAVSGVQHAVVLADDDSASLIAWYTGQLLEKGYPESELARYLPEYMIPHTFIFLPAFPLTANGKIDRKKLLAEIPVHHKTTVATDADETTLMVMRAWAQVLGISHISLQDDFFELGGHSITLIKLVNIYARTFNVRIPLKTLFEARKVQGHAALIRETHLPEKTEISPAEYRESYPLSPAQLRLWILSRFGEGNTAYNIPLFLRMNGKLDIEKFSAAVQLIINRHEILRTVFRESSDGTPQQVILQSIPAVITLLRAGEMEAAAMAGYTFDLEHGPLFRIWLTEEMPDRWSCCFNIHHIICDAWSLEILLKELWICYNTLMSGHMPILPDLAIQYKDYTLWQQQSLESGELAIQRQYWLDTLRENIPVLELPLSNPRPAVKSFNGKRQYFNITDADIHKTRQYCLTHNGTLFIGALCAVYSLLSRYTGQEDIIIGSPVAGRDHHDLHEQVGYYGNFLALRAHIQQADSFNQLFEAVRDEVTNALQHKDYPFDRLIDELELRRDASRSPLFDVAVVFDHAGNVEAADIPDVSGLDISYVREERAAAKFDLNIVFTESAKGLDISITYNTDLFNDAFITRMGHHLRRLMTDMEINAGTPLNAIGFMTPEENRLLWAEGDNMATDTGEINFVKRFEQHAQATPDAKALVFENRECSYRELNNRANVIAAQILKHTKGDNLNIAILLERNIDYVAAMLGVLKAGACYVPLDTSYPAERQQFMISDSNAALVITDHKTQQYIIDYIDTAALSGKLFVIPDIVAESSNPVIIPDTNANAYIIYTSGTTGAPKGVMVGYKNLQALVQAADKAFNFNSADRFTLFHSFCFDFSVWETFIPLINGATALIIPASLSRDPHSFAEFLLANKVTVLNQTPSSWYMLMDVLRQTDPVKDLRYLIFGGDALIPSRLEQWMLQNTAVKVINMYGITETTVHVTIKEIGTEETTKPASIIGHPIPGWHCLVLDTLQKPVPVGIPGELFVGGNGVAAGYINSPELTAAKFVTISGRRYYRTGDKVRRTESGELEFISRLDQQVKIRGYRIEKGEVEHGLMRSGKFTDVKVRVVEDDNSKELVAYYTSAEPADIPSLRGFLSAFLPAFMIPAYFIRMDKIPLNANGKIDERKLPGITAATRNSSISYMEPGTDTEKKLSEIWQRILNTDHIGIHDNFFELGGHSLKAAILLTEIKQAFHIRLKLESVLLEPTIAGLAVIIDNLSSLINVAPGEGKRKIVI